MATISASELLKDRDIVNEINKHKWFESEKQGFDIGFERASREWINSYSKQYFTTHPNKTALIWLKGVLNKKIC